MRLLRLSPGPLLLACLASGAAMLVSACLPGAGLTKQILWDAGSSGLVLLGVLWAVVLWGGVYLMVIESSRGMPGLHTVGEPAVRPESADRYRALRQSLSALGFSHEGWFSLDDFAQTHVGAWTHASGQARAFVLYCPVGGRLLLRFVSPFAGGKILVSSTRLTDLAYPPPPGIYFQARKATTAEELWAWHVEAEQLFPACDPVASKPAAELFVEVAARRGRHRRSDPTWLLAVEPFEECWRMWRLCGVSLREQVARGWASLGNERHE
jgi:hypothetical protein